MRLERPIVSRKTPRDGRLEISSDTAARLERLGADFPIEVGGVGGRATLELLSCTCRGPDAKHSHRFLRSDLLMALTPETRVELEIDASGDPRVVIRPAQS